MSSLGTSMHIARSAVMTAAAGFIATITSFAHPLLVTLAPILVGLSVAVFAVETRKLDRESHTAPSLAKRRMLGWLLLSADLAVVFGLFMLSQQTNIGWIRSILGIIMVVLWVLGPVAYQIGYWPLASTLERNTTRPHHTFLPTN